MRHTLEVARGLWRDRRGITGLETAIVLIAFVVVSSVFAFAALSTGLFTSDKSKETIHAGLDEARGTLEMRGALIAKVITTGGASVPNVVDELLFQVANAAGGATINLTPGMTIIRYTDTGQTLSLTGDDFTATGLGLADTDNLVEAGEIYEVKITGMAAKLSPDLGTADTFTVEAIPPQGAVLRIERLTPVALTAYTDLG